MFSPDLAILNKRHSSLDEEYYRIEVQLRKK